MADKVNKEESIARVYQFLNSHKNWKTEADLNDDKTIIKTEFRTYLLDSNFKWNEGENKNDIISAFWNSIDVNTSGTIGAGSKISNQNALDGKELNRIDNNVLATTVVSDFMNENNVAAPSGNGGISAKYQAKWKESVKAGILNQVIAYLRNYEEKFETKDDLKAYLGDKLAEFCQNSSAKATADYKALDKMEELTAQFKNTDIDYKPQSDDTLGGIIDAYISGDGITGKSSTQITSDINLIVNAYIALADDNANNDAAALSILQQYDSTVGDGLNQLQIAVLSAKFKDAVVKDLKSTKADFYNSNADAINAAIASYIEKGLTSSSDDFNTIVANMSNLVKVFKDSQLATLEADYNKLVSDRAALIIAIGKEYNNKERNSERKAAIKQVFGSDVVAEYTKNIQGLSRADFDAKKAEFEGLIKAIDAKLPDNFLDGVPTTMTCIQGGTFTPVQLTNYYGSQYPQGHLHFKEMSGCAALSVGDSGAITVNSGNIGQWTAQIGVYDDNGVLIAGPKSIVVNVIKSMKLEESDKTFNGQTMSFVLSNVAENAIQLSGFQKWSNAKTIAKQSIRNYVTVIKSSLSSSSYDLSRLEKAAQNTIYYYTAIIDAIQDQISSSGDGMKNVTFTYVDANGKTHTEISTFSQYTRSSERRAGRTDWGAKVIDQGSTGIRMNESYNSSNTYEYYLNSAVLLRKFQEFYNSI